MRAADARPELGDRLGHGLASLERRLERLPDTHPASPRYSPADRVPEVEERADDVRPLTDAEHAEHVAEVRTRLDEARKAGLATDSQYTIDRAHEIWSDEREALHDHLLDELYAGAASVPNDHQAIIAGGIAGAGKTTVLTEHAGIDLDRYLMINPDVIKEKMAEHGLVPEVDGLTPMEASELVHEECSHLAKRLAHRAHADGKNVIWDVTMSKTSSADERIDWLRNAGYERIRGIFVDISIEVSQRRTDARQRQGHDEWRVGLGYGGRYIPPEMISAQADPDCGTKNRSNFEQLKHRFDSWSLYDNSVDGRSPILAESEPGTRRPHRDDDRSY
jgi:predicted ABC-type ATPase